MRTLTWYVAHPPLGSGQWETYRMDGDYRPVRAWVHFDQAPTVEEIIIDLKADGESLFAYMLRAQDVTDAEEDSFSTVQISRDTYVSMEISQRGGNPGAGMTVGLDLEDA